MEELIKKIKEIDKKIKDYEEENKKYMSKGEMEYIREKCTNNKPISVSELTRYFKSFYCNSNIINLNIEKGYLITELKTEIENIKKYINNESIL